MSDERRLRVLRAIVHDYVQTSEPVGSKALLDRHNLGVSAATVRNDMAALEEDGLITAPHTSAGRVPTDAGYRLFVDRLSTVKPLSRAERSAIQRFLEGAVDLDDIVGRTVRLLASLTNQVAVVQYPSLSRATVRHVELVPMGPHRLMVVLIVNSGRVEQRVVETDIDLSATEGETAVQELRTLINAEASGQPLAQVPGRLEQAISRLPHDRQTMATGVTSALAEALLEQVEERVLLAGTANLARSGADFPLTIGPVLEALEEHVVLLKLMRSVGDVGTDDAVAVSIGTENAYEPLRTTSVITTAYGPAGGLGVVGPTRMDYAMTMASVRAVAQYLSQILDS